MLWSDVVRSEVTDNQRRRMYRCPGSDSTDPHYIRHKVKNPDSLMVKGSFSYFGVGKLKILPKNNHWTSAAILNLSWINLKTVCQSVRLMLSCTMS